MKHVVSITHGGHSWEKQNLITVREKGRPVDKVICKGCGIIGLRARLDQVEIDGRHSVEQVDFCRGNKNSQRVKITRCTAQGMQFANLTPGSEHDVVNTPKGENDKRGVWVMGVGEPVKVLYDEFEFIKS